MVVVVAWPADWYLWDPTGTDGKTNKPRGQSSSWEVPCPDTEQFVAFLCSLHTGLLKSELHQEAWFFSAVLLHDGKGRLWAPKSHQRLSNDQEWWLCAAEVIWIAGLKCGHGSNYHSKYIQSILHEGGLSQLPKSLLSRGHDTPKAGGRHIFRTHIWSHCLVFKQHGQLKWGGGTGDQTPKNLTNKKTPQVLGFLGDSPS